MDLDREANDIPVHYLPPRDNDHSDDPNYLAPLPRESTESSYGSKSNSVYEELSERSSSTEVFLMDCLNLAYPHDAEAEAEAEGTQPQREKDEDEDEDEDRDS